MPPRTGIAIFLLAGVYAQTPASQPPQPAKQQRDLVIEKERPLTPASASPASTSPRRVTIPRSYALVIGVSQYKNLPANLQLDYSVRDAEYVYAALISPEEGNFRAENVHKLIDSRATLANLRHELEEWLPSVTKDEDRVLIYFAGHGFTYGGKGFLAPYDFDRDRAESTGYSMDQLGHVVGASIKGKWKVLLTDSCHSGAITPETSRALVNQGLQNLNPSVFSLTASRDREQSFEDPGIGGGHGFFTYYVVKGMEGEADENGDGKITADELAEYVRVNVRRDTGGKQNPTSDRGSFEKDMLIAYNPSGAKPGAPPPAQFGELIFESNMDDVELLVDDDPARLLKKGQAFHVPGLRPGLHTIKAVKMGYEPDGPRSEMVYPGQQATVKIRILILRHRSKAATDVFDQGVKQYTKGGEANYKQAEQSFRRALSIDPQYSPAAMYLGRTLNALFKQEEAEAAYRRAIEIDPDYVEARTSLGGMLLDKGKTDDAIRELNAVVQREPDNAEALYLLAEAFRINEAYPQSIDAARKAIRSAPNNAEAHFWLAEGLRMSNQWEPSVAEYKEYLRLSNFDSKLAGKVNYYVLGYLTGLGWKHRATLTDIWSDLRGLAYFGLCDSEKNLQRYNEALEACSRSLSYAPKDPYTHLTLGMVYAHKAQAEDSPEMLAAAEKHFRDMLAINPDMEEAPRVRKMLASFDAELAKLR